MNIKITIRDADTSPLVVHKNQMSEVEFKKKKSLYQPAQRDSNAGKRQKSIKETPKMSKDDKNLRQTGLRSSGQDQVYRQAEKKMMKDLDEMSKNQASLDMIQNSNNILRRQNEILEDNQRNIHNMMKNQQSRKNNTREEKISPKQVQGLLAQVKKEVDQMRGIKEEIQKAGKEVTKMLAQASKPGRQVNIQNVSDGVNSIQGNIRHLSEISKNQLQGLENLQGIKNLQNFNIEAYTQAINGLKRQIVQYQKQSEQIERQLKIRYSKLEQLKVQPHFDQKILEPYEAYLKRKAEAIDLHSIKDRIYQKLGHFDYGKFEYDISQVMAGVKNQMNEFNIVCKQYRVDVPTFKIDPKELKGLDLRLNSALDEYKAERGIDFSDKNKKNEAGSLSDSRRKERRPGEAILTKEDQKKPKNRVPKAIRQLNTKPIDNSHSVKYQKTNEPTQKTVLQNQQQRDRKDVNKNMKKAKIKEQQDFDKYLQYRARQQLQILYKEKEARLKKTMKDLYVQMQKDEPQVHLHLDLRNQINRQVSEDKKNQRQRSADKRGQERENSAQKKNNLDRNQIDQDQVEYQQLKPLGLQGQKIKEIGTEVLKEKLKMILGPQRKPQEPSRIPYQASVSSQPQLQNVAQNFIGLINKTLTQVNNQLSQTIQQRIQNKSLSRQKKAQRRSPQKLQIPKLAQFAPPPVMPVFNYAQPAYPNPSGLSQKKSLPKPTQKMVVKKYQELQIEDSYEKQELQISDNYSDNFEQP